MKLDDYVLLGRSGLRVSPLALGTMTFGKEWGWGVDQTEAGRILGAYMDAGGNFIDTANVYTNGGSEKMLGQLLQGQRQRVVLATKYSLNLYPGDPNGGGNHRKSMVQSVEESLKRLDTDYIDLLYLHAWDGLTPPDEVVRALDDLVRAGKVLYTGLSDVPAWLAAQMQTLATAHDRNPFVSLQIQYSLAERTVERELIPMARALGMGVTAWSPLAMGVLIGKYKREDLAAVNADATLDSASRLSAAATHDMLTEHNLAIADVVQAIAREKSVSPAQIALAWLIGNRNANIPIIGVSSLRQLQDNLAALELTLSPEEWHRLDEVSRIVLGFPHDFLELAPPRQLLTGGTRIARQA